MLLGRFRAELKRPATLISIALACVSIFASLFISIYFYGKSIRAGEISFSVEQVQVFSSEFGSDHEKLKDASIAVLDRNGNKILDNIYAAKIKLWNSGNDEIRMSDVRSAPKIIYDEEVRVIDIVQGATTMNNIDGFNISADGVLGWKHFDPGQGVIVTVLYSNERQVEIHVDAFIPGIQRPKDFGHFFKARDNWISAWPIVVFPFLLVVNYVVDLTTKNVFLEGNYRTFKRRVLRFSIFSFLFVVSFYAAFVAYSFFGLDRRPPL